jgi:hypothetical protein
MAREITKFIIPAFNLLSVLEVRRNNNGGSYSGGEVKCINLSSENSLREATCGAKAWRIKFERARIL